MTICSERQKTLLFRLIFVQKHVCTETDLLWAPVESPSVSYETGMRVHSFCSEFQFTRPSPRITSVLPYTLSYQAPTHSRGLWANLYRRAVPSGLLENFGLDKRKRQYQHIYPQSTRTESSQYERRDDFDNWEIRTHFVHIFLEFVVGGTGVWTTFRTTGWVALNLQCRYNFMQLQQHRQAVNLTQRIHIERVRLSCPRVCRTCPCPPPSFFAPQERTPNNLTWRTRCAGHTHGQHTPPWTFCALWGHTPTYPLWIPAGEAGCAGYTYWNRRVRRCLRRRKGYPRATSDKPEVPQLEGWGYAGRTHENTRGCWVCAGHDKTNTLTGMTKYNGEHPCIGLQSTSRTTVNAKRSTRAPTIFCALWVSGGTCT